MKLLGVEGIYFPRVAMCGPALLVYTIGGTLAQCDRFGIPDKVKT